MKALKPAFVALLLGIAIFSSYKYFSSIKERYELLDKVQGAQERVLAVETERGNLLKDLENERNRQKGISEENAGLKQQLTTAQADLARMQGDLQAAQQTVEELTNKFSLAKAENDALMKQVAELKGQNAAAVQEKEQLKARLNSLVELKMAIRELKRKLRRAKSEINLRLQSSQLVIGNGGYMIKDGKPTYPTRVKIEVVPLPDGPGTEHDFTPDASARSGAIRNP